MWTLKAGLEECGTLQRIVEQHGFSVALYGSVLKSGAGDDLDVFLVPQRPDADVRSAVDAVRNGLQCDVTGPLLGDLNRLVCVVRLQPGPIDIQITRLTARPLDVAEMAVCYEL
jgi:hypothetical protein